MQKKLSFCCIYAASFALFIPIASKIDIISKTLNECDDELNYYKQINT